MDGSATVDGNGTAVLSVLMVAPGNHTITAVYAGTANSAGSTSAVLNEVVQPALAATTTTLTASANPAPASESVTFTANVVAAGRGKAPGGAVTFVEGGTVLGSATVNAVGAAVWSTSALSVGSHSIVAWYAGGAGTAASISAALTEVVNDPAPSGAFTISVDQITAAAGDTATVPVKVAMGSGFAKAVSLSCNGLPEEASCSFVSGTVAPSGGTVTLRISTAGPRDCGSSIPYGASKSAGLPVAGPVLAGLLLVLVPGRRRTIKGLLVALFAVTEVGAMTGCGTGNCTDLGTRPGTYTITLTGSASGVVSQKVKLVLKP